MTPVKILALLVAVLGAVKLVVVFVRPKAWLPVVKTVYGKPLVTTIVALAAAAVILKYLLTELTIIQIFAVMSFMMALMAVGVAAYGKEVVELAEKVLQEGNSIKRAGLSIGVWVVLIVWVLYALFV